MSLVVDTSAVMAIVLDEPGAAQLAKRLAAHDRPIISAVSVVETTIVAEARLDPVGTILVQQVIREARITTIDVTSETALDALEGGGRTARVATRQRSTSATASHMRSPSGCGHRSSAPATTSPAPTLPSNRG